MCLFCHSELYRRRPAPRELTTFYFFVAAGGALGAILVGIVAPYVLSGDYELGSTTATVTLRGRELALALPGQPACTLEPLHGTTFRVKELSGTTIEFRLDGERVVAAGFYQPDGDYLAKRRPEGATGGH